MARVAPRKRASGAGFTLLEVLVAVAILSITLTSLLSSQMDALRATRYAQDVSAAAFLAEQQLIEIEFELKQDGWGNADKEFDGTFAEQGWPNIHYVCLVDMIEMPDYTALQAAADAGDTDGPGSGLNVQDSGEQAFGMMGIVWPIIKDAIEQAIRKASCTVTWSDGKVEHDFSVMTFWTDVSALNALPSLGGEATDDDGEDDGGGAGAGGGQGSGAGGSAGGGAPTPGIRGGGLKPGGASPRGGR